MRIIIDRDACLGCEVCVDLVPDILEMDEDVPRLTVEVVPDDLQDETREAADACPAGAITIEEDESEVSGLGKAGNNLH